MDTLKRLTASVWEEVKTHLYETDHMALIRRLDSAVEGAERWSDHLTLSLNPEELEAVNGIIEAEGLNDEM